MNNHIRPGEIITLQIGTILFGVGDGITKIKLNSDCSIIKGNIFDKDILEFLDETPSSMRRKYPDAINHTDGTFYWIKAEYMINSMEFVENETELKYLTLIDKQIRMLRLSLKRYVYVKDFRYIVNISKDSRICSNFPSPDFGTEETINSAINLSEYTEIERILKEDIPFDNHWIYNVFLVYEKSFSKDIEVSFITIVSALEMIFVDDNNHIKEKLSKRIAVYMSNDFDVQQDIYKQIKKMYKKRCAFVHEGKNELITMDELWYLRNIANKVIIQFMQTNKKKKDFCTELVEKVKSVDCWKE